VRGVRMKGRGRGGVVGVSRSERGGKGEGVRKSGRGGSCGGE
jgi:hypothetical protein